MGLSQFDERIIDMQATTFLAADGIGFKNVCDNTPRPTRIDHILATNTDVIAHVIRLYGNQSGKRTLLGSATIPAGQGQAGTPCIDVLALSRPVNCNYQFTDFYTVLDASLEVAVTAAFEVNLWTLGGEV